MKLKVGIDEYKFPPCERVTDAYIEGNQPHNQMHAILMIGCDFNQFTFVTAVDQKASGMPKYFFIANGSIKFYPTPDKSYAVRVIYQPPRKMW